MGEPTIWVTWFLKSAHRFCVSQYAVCSFWKSPHSSTSCWVALTCVMVRQSQWSGSGRGLAGYVPGSGYAGTAAGAQKMNELEQRLAVADARDAANDTRLEKLEEMVQKLIELSTVPEELKSLRSKNTQLEKKMALIEHLLLQTSATQNGGDNDTFTTVEVRLITKPAGHGRLECTCGRGVRCFPKRTHHTMRNTEPLWMCSKPPHSYCLRMCFLNCNASLMQSIEVLACSRKPIRVMQLHACV